MRSQQTPCLHSELILSPQWLDTTQQTNPIPIDDSKTINGPWLLRRTSVHVQSSPAEVAKNNTLSDHASSVSSTRRKEKSTIRTLLARLEKKHSEEPCRDSESFSSYKSAQFGTIVSIEAAQPKAYRRHEPRGLEQAASDPELWDPSGDTLIYFGYQRPQASFRVRSSTLRKTKSEMLDFKLQAGPLRVVKQASWTPPTTAGSKVPNIGDNHKKAVSVSLESGRPTSEAEIHYEMHFPAPEDASRLDVLRHHITTRNFFALLHSKPFVGLTFYQALMDLHERLQDYMPKGINCIDMIVDSLMKNDHVNVCNDPAAAIGLLAWSEDEEVHWREGWHEGFVHCVGMYEALQGLPEYSDLSQYSRTLLQHAFVELQEKIRFAENILSNFSLSNLRLALPLQAQDARASFDRFSRFLQDFYGRTYKKWPPLETRASDATWLRRSIVSHLQEDFGALYQYCVDRDVNGFSKSSDDHDPEPGRRKYPAKNQIDDDIVSLANLLANFDRKQGFPHIPYPLPLLPASVATNDKERSHKQSFFSSKSRTLEKRILHAYSQAYNALHPGRNVITNSLVRAFIHFEATDHLRDVDPRDARRGRWILLYGILQVLATLSVDTPDLCFKGGVEYFLNLRFHELPPWIINSGGSFEDASHKESFCWKVPESWDHDRAHKIDSG